MKNIAFIGKAGAGKTTAAEFCEHVGYKRYSFANPLKDIAEILWGCEARIDRDKLQKLGVAVREIEEDTWLNLALDSIEQDPYPAVVDDCRFLNEAWALDGLGFVFVRIETAVEVRTNRLIANHKFTSEEQMNHISETALNEWKATYTIKNNGDLIDFVEQVAKTVRTING